MKRKIQIKPYFKGPGPYRLRLRPVYRKSHGIIGLYCVHKDCGYNSASRKRVDEGEEDAVEFGFCLNTWKNMYVDEHARCCSRVYKGAQNYMRKLFLQMFQVGDWIEVPVTLLDGRILDPRERHRVRTVQIVQILPYTCVVSDTVGKHCFTRSLSFSDLIGGEMARRERVVMAQLAE
ncbi:MAG: hypothetical protein Q4C55_03990 [Eubacterium sp.]|nr:hypothetical protein [Eubacterium sp.]